jgi:hypothetical protein
MQDAAQHGTAQHSTAQHSTAQRSAARRTRDHQLDAPAQLLLDLAEHQLVKEGGGLHAA